MKTFTVKPIGYAETPHKEQKGTPIQANFSDESKASIVINPEFRQALADLKGFERIWVLSWLDQSTEYKLKVVPYRDTVERGLFATRAPRRPNPIGLSCVKVDFIDCEKGIIELSGIDLLDDTPIIDIKPYIPSIDAYPDSNAGWFDRGLDITTADERFSKD